MYYLGAITLPDGTVVPSDPSSKPIWAGIGPGSIPYIGNQSPAAGGHSGMEPGQLAQYFGWGAPPIGGKQRPWGWGLPPVALTPAGAPGPCGPGTNDPNCTGGVTSLPPVIPGTTIVCPAGQQRINGQCVVTVVETPPLTTPVAPRTHRRAHRAILPTRTPYAGDRPDIRDSGETCPIRGYVSRPVPGADEYQNFRCTPGQPVVIDPGWLGRGRPVLMRGRVVGLAYGPVSRAGGELAPASITRGCGIAVLVPIPWEICHR